MRSTFVILLFLLSLSTIAQQPPKIGLTLSGGGAKGLAHIGILQAIDSAGLNIDYITGTSMGSIMGALYAAGYSGNEMELIAREINWASLFSGKALLRNVSIDEKDEFDQYAIEIPVEKGKLKIGTGLIEGQEIWLKFQELFLPVYSIKDFSQFSIPFQCIATDVGTGEVVVLDKGEIVTAIRASMAIPSVFTAIDYKDTKLVDGGVVRNFPVRNVKAMGADYAIGVNLSQGLLKADQLNSAVEILYQIAFYKDAEDFNHEKKLCNILIEPPVSDYSAGSFGSAEELIAIGREWGRKYYPAFKQLADSLKALDPSYAFKRNRLPPTRKLIVNDIRIAGLKNTTEKFFTSRLGIEIGKSYDGEEIADAIRKVYGSRSYNRIAYHWEPRQPGSATLVFNVVENPLTYLKVGLHFHSFSEAALITTITSRNLFSDRSQTLLKLNISENFRLLFEQKRTFGRRDNNTAIFSLYHERFIVPIYQDFKQTYLYRNRFTQVDLKIQHTFNQNSTLGIGTSYEEFILKPKVASTVSIEAGNHYFHTYGYYQLNTLNRKHFSTSGWKVYGQLGQIYRQRPDELFYTIGSESGIIDSLSFQNYGQLRIQVENYHPLNQNLTFLSQLNSGLNLNDKQSFLNFFNVGGLNDFLRNQITFAGLNEYQVNTNSIVALGIGFQYEPIHNLFATLKANIGLHNFTYEVPEAFDTGSFLSGYSLTGGYASALGPLQLSIMYCDQAKSFSGYVNIGFTF